MEETTAAGARVGAPMAAVAQGVSMGQLVGGEEEEGERGRLPWGGAREGEASTWTKPPWAKQEERERRGRKVS